MASVAQQGEPTDLANFSTVSFTGCDFTRLLSAGTSDVQGVGNIPHSASTMFDTGVTPNKQLDSVRPTDSTRENSTTNWSASS